MAAKRPKSARARAASGERAGQKGKSAATADLRLLARDAALAALKRLGDLSRSEDERIALAATQELLNRAFGRISATGADEPPATQPLVIKIVRFCQSTKPRQSEDA